MNAIEQVGLKYGRPAQEKANEGGRWDSEKDTRKPFVFIKAN